MFEKLSEAISRLNNPTVMGLDPTLDYIPAHIRAGRRTGDAIFEFNRGLIDCAAGLVPAVKPQSAFYEMYGPEGLDALRRTIDYAADAGMYVILDAKRGDIGSTAAAYAAAYLGEDSKIDALTVNPYLGIDGVKPFLDLCGKNGRGIFVLVKTSNPSSADFQDLDCGGVPLYRRVAEKVAQWGGSIGSDGYNACGAVAGATYPRQLAELRRAMPQTFLLVPGYGAQGGSAADVLPAFDAKGGGAVVNSSRALMCAYMGKSDDQNYQKYTREAVLAMREALNSR